jgi:hypothetical protein
MRQSNQIFIRIVVRTMVTLADKEKNKTKEKDEEFALCVECGNAIEKCVCVCPYCGERDKCECALFEAATGG